MDTPSAAKARRIFYTLTLTRWFPVGLVVGILVLLATTRGLTTAQALTCLAVAGFVCAALELPTSGFADAFGRRPVYLVAAVVNVGAALAFATAHSFVAFMVAAALTGVFRALDSGPLEAWFVDAVHEEEPGKDVDQELARAGTLLGVGMAAGAVISGALIWWHPVTSQPPLDLVVWCFAALNLVHLVATARLLTKTPGRTPSSSPRNTPSSTPSSTPWIAALASVRRTPAVITEGLALVRSNRVLAGVLLAEMCWSVGMVAVESIMPLRLEELVGTAQRAGALMGPASAAGWGVFSLGTWLAGRASARFGVARAAALGRGLNALGVVLMAISLGPVSLLAAYLFTYSTHGLNSPPHAALLHREARAGNRSTVLSLNSMVAFLAAGTASPLAGALAERTSLALAMLAVGVLSMFGTLAYLPARRAERRTASPRSRVAQCS